MGKKKGGRRKMAATAAKIVDFSLRKYEKDLSQYIQVKPIKRLSAKDMKESEDFIKHSWKRD
ncbi:hypothetical protein [Paenibacillus thalictri]|uniref:Uncharacterized protein n=1 Tax=Paenibacillus thalictri TaxID=2527873 RepID=A0A4Q9DLD2_9BACL|nr:hypothetical protein [Paenibacillus thalictri]TBL75985.1 hypothetical protein EYB31_20715 [Paenibacillus thalictri]